MNSHYYSERPSTSGKTITINTHQLGHSLTFTSQSGIFNWKKVDTGSEILLNNLVLPKNGFVLDLGCGYGFLGVALAKAYPELSLVLTDINELAVKCSQKNCIINEVTKNTIVKQGNLYEPIKNYMFDSIITNPPLMAGKNVLNQIISQSKGFLNIKGSLQLVVPKGKGLVSMQKMITEIYGFFEVIAKKSGYWILKATI
ncbi:MAG: class I SAM-dependent methyltransferase [Candidatus Heimdallarchaeota archaeon]|nr:class I SAM-dependent methyltransferase [Candidatus Heimdallarchaeota archaeon]